MLYYFEIICCSLFCCVLCFRNPLNTLEALSQTDITCAWTATKETSKAQYKPVPTEAMACFKLKYRFVELPDTEMINILRNNFIRDLPNSALGVHRSATLLLLYLLFTYLLLKVNLYITFFRTGCTHISQLHLESLLEILLQNSYQSIVMLELNTFNVKVNNCCQMFLNKFNDNEYIIARQTKNSKLEWFHERLFRVTGSRIYELFTYNIDGDWKHKCKRYFFPKNFTNKYVQYGQKYEQEARNVFTENTGLNIHQFGLITSSINSWLGYSPDGIIFNENNPIALIEIKCPFAGNLA